MNRMLFVDEFGLVLESKQTLYKLSAEAAQNKVGLHYVFDGHFWQVEAVKTYHNTHIFFMKFKG